MCEANAYFVHKDGKIELVLESVDKLIPTDDGLLLENIFSQRKLLKAKIKEMALVEHRIMLED